MKLLFGSIAVYLTVGLSGLNAQEVISSAGTQAAGTTVSLAWTVGEPVIGTVSNGSYTLTQGFHQPRISSSAVDDAVIPGLSLDVYPNPSTDELNLRINEGDLSQFQYSLITLEGKTLLLKKISKNLTRIDMNTYAAGSYLLKIIAKNGKPVKAFKIVKQ
jgi:hypothetical protein